MGMNAIWQGKVWHVGECQGWGIQLQRGKDEEIVVAYGQEDLIIDCTDSDIGELTDGSYWEED